MNKKNSVSQRRLIVQACNGNAHHETFLTEEDFRKAAPNKEIDGGYDVSAMYSKDKFEGDIVMEPGTRSMIKDKIKQWPSPMIPYTISCKYSKQNRAMPARVIQSFQNRTCIRFVPKKPDDKNYVHISAAKSCYSLVGRIGGRQEVVIGSNWCMKFGVIQHELMHTLGFYHEQSRYDRDQYVKILWENIDNDMESQFRKADKRGMDTLGEKYDLNSVMHYSSLAFSMSPSKPSMLTKSGEWISPAKFANFNDMQKINKLFKCRERKW